MKTKLIPAAVIILALSVPSVVFGQDALIKTKTKSNQSNDRSAEQNTETCVVKLVSSDSGCDIVFLNEPAKSREAGSGMATGRRMHKPISFAVNSSDNSVSEIKSPRDAASGLATGKRSPGNPIGGLTIKGGKNPGGNQFNGLAASNGQFTLPADCPNGEYDLILSWSWGASNSGSSNLNCSCHFMLTMVNGACMAIKTKGTGAAHN